jgi:hypothetical protein
MGAFHCLFKTSRPLLHCTSQGFYMIYSLNVMRVVQKLYYLRSKDRNHIFIL